MRAEPLDDRQTEGDGIIATEELYRRPARPPNYEAECRALTMLARHMTLDPHGVLQKLTELIVDLSEADAAGACVLDTFDGNNQFHWHASAGRFGEELLKVIPGDTNPCAKVISSSEVLLFTGGDRYFPPSSGLQARLYENLLVPWSVNGRKVGALWVVAHSLHKRFDAEDVRLLQSLSSFASAAWQVISALDKAEAGKEALEARVEERTRELSNANEALLQSEARLRSVLNVDTVGVIYFDMSGHILDANDAFLAMSGFTRHDLRTGMLTRQRLTPPEWREVSLRAFLDIKKRGRTTPYEREYLRRDGSRWWALFDAKLLNDLTIVEFVIDITERKHAEQLLKEADRRKDAFLATLAHELRNPLAPISNAMQLLQTASSDGRRMADRLLVIVQRQVSNIVRLVDDLLEMSRIATGKIELRKAPVLLSDIVRDAIDTCQPQISGARHQLAVCLPQEPLLLEADSVRLTQIFANLLINSAKYTDPGGSILLTGRREGPCAVVSVKDNGIGISQDMLPHIFEMFAQAFHSGDRGKGGLGIGLHMVRNLVELHGGTIEARSEGPGCGSEFIVSLPLIPGTYGVTTRSEQEAEAAMSFSGCQILVVDDNRDAADSLAMLLVARGAAVEVFYNGPDLLAELGKHCPQAIVLDIGMPGMSGHEVARQIRQDARFAAVKLIALTGWGQEADRLQSQASGFDLHLTKPVDIAVLEAFLAEASSA